MILISYFSHNFFYPPENFSTFTNFFVFILLIIVASQVSMQCSRTYTSAFCLLEAHPQSPKNVIFDAKLRLHFVDADTFLLCRNIKKEDNHQFVFLMIARILTSAASVSFSCLPPCPSSAKQHRRIPHYPSFYKSTIQLLHYHSPYVKFHLLQLYMFPTAPYHLAQMPLF